MVRYLFYTIGDLTYQSPLVVVSSSRFEMSGTKLPIDAASYPRRTKMSVTPLRKCKKSLNARAFIYKYLQVIRGL